MTDLSCPVCGSEFDLATAFASEADREALSRLVAISIPIGARVLKYIGLHQPERQRLTTAKKIKLLLQLLPDLEREVVKYKGRDWSAPHSAWAIAIDQMFDMRAAGRLDTPVKGHNYLYATLAGMADKHEAETEQQRDADLRNAGRAHSSATPTNVGELLQKPAPRTQPQLAPAQPGGMSPTVRAIRAAIEKKQGI